MLEGMWRSVDAKYVQEDGYLEKDLDLETEVQSFEGGSAGLWPAWLTPAEVLGVV